MEVTLESPGKTDLEPRRKQQAGVGVGGSESEMRGEGRRHCALARGDGGPARNPTSLSIAHLAVPRNSALKLQHGLPSRSHRAPGMRPMGPSHSQFSGKQVVLSVSGQISGERAGAGGGLASGLQRKPATPGYVARPLKCAF